MTRAIALALVVAAGCFPEVDLELPEGYEGWHRVDALGPLPAHGDTYRIIYVNDVARTWTGAGPYPDGSILIKEVYHRDGDQPAGLSYLAAMRRLERAPDGAELHEGWLYTYIGEEGAAEEYRARCYQRCHASAPYDGPFLDYRY